MPLSGDTLLFALIGIAGFFGGVFITLLLSRLRKPRAHAEPDIPVQEPAPVLKPAPEPVFEALPVMPERHPSETHLWRDPESGKVMAEVDGMEFADPINLSTEQRRKLVQLLRETAGWFNDNGAKPAKPPAAVQPQPLKAAPPSTPAAHAAPPPVQPEPAATILIEPRRTGALPPLPGEKPPDVKKTAPFSIVTQIDAILQGMLQESDMKAKGIRLVEDAGGGVTVWVGMKRYPGIDAVSDPEALAMIRAAVSEWERQSMG
jgi:hypothetical protein